MGRADRVLVKTGAAHRFLVGESPTLLRQDKGGGVPHWTPGSQRMTVCLRTMPEKVDW